MYVSQYVYILLQIHNHAHDGPEEGVTSTRYTFLTAAPRLLVGCVSALYITPRIYRSGDSAVQCQLYCSDTVEYGRYISSSYYYYYYIKLGNLINL
eukprot:sb/3479179/